MAGVPRKPSDSFDPWAGWEISARNPFLPVGEYTNEAGDVSAGFAMPSIVSEPVNALARLLNTPAGTMPNPQNPEMQQDALTGLLSLYGGNSMSGMARGAGRNALATKALSDTGKPSPVGSAIGSALDMSPEARLARAREQGFDTDATWYHGTDRDFDAFDNDLATFGIGTWFSDTKHYADWMHGGRGRTLETRLRMRNPYHYDVMEEALKLRDDYGDGFVEPRTSREALQLLSGSGGIDNFVANLASKARQKGHDSLILRNFDDRESGFSGPNKAAAIVFDPSNIRSVNAAFDPARVGENGLLLSDTGRPSIMGSAVAASSEFDPYADIPPWLLGLDERVTY